jgi:hypothetical protein
VIEELGHVLGQPGDAIAVVGFLGDAVPPEVDRDHPSGQALELVPEHRLGLAPTVQHDQREPVAATVAVVQRHAVSGGHPCRPLVHVVVWVP